VINTIDLDDLRDVDLNLIPVFLALLAERSTIRAAERLGVGQPAISASLARLRAIYGDPLFVRVPRGMEPTARALQLGAALHPALVTIRQSLVPAESFDPSTAKFTLRIGMPDNHEHFVVPKLLARLQREAPNVRLAVRPTSGATAGQLLDSEDIDLACGRIDKIGAWQRREELFQIQYLCLYDNRLTPLPDPLTLDAFLSEPHLLVSPKGDFAGVVDDQLSRMGKQRRVIFVTTNFSTLPVVLKQVRGVATLPAPSARKFAADYGLSTAEPPVTLSPYHTALAWLAKHDENPAHRWAREFLKATLATLTEADHPGGAMPGPRARGGPRKPPKPRHPGRSAKR